MKTVFLYALLGLIFCSTAFFPTQAQIKRAAIQKQLNAEEYQKALDEIGRAGCTKADSGFCEYTRGLCKLQLGHPPHEALHHLKNAIQYYPLSKSLDEESGNVWFFYAQALHANYHFQEAIAVYNDLKSRLSPKKGGQLEAVNRELAYCETAQRLAQNPVEFKITNLGKALNTKNDEHSPVVTINEDQIIFTSNRNNGKPNEVIENLYTSQWREGKWLPARRLTGQIAKYYNNASVSINNDGTQLILYAYDGKSGNLYYSLNKKGNWGAPVKFPSPINSMHNETHASLTMDGQTIFFSSDRPGGFGGKDIYTSRILPSGEWGPAINLGSLINTELDEESPFIMPDGKTLFLTSEGHENMGGFDIFKTQLDSAAQWSKPQNIGYPINTPGDDLFYCPTADGLRVYYASTREGTMGNTDLFLIEYPSDDDRRMAVVSGFIYAKDQTPAADADITVESAEDGDFTGFYKPNPTTGKYVLLLQTGKTYQITFSKPGTDAQTLTYRVPVKGEYAARGLVHYIKPVTLEN